MPYVTSPINGLPYWSSGNEPAGWVHGLSPVSLFHADRCEHDQITSEAADHSVGFSGGIWCEDCGADLTDSHSRDDWDDGDRAYDAWKDEREWDRDRD